MAFIKKRYLWILGAALLGAAILAFEGTKLSNDNTYTVQSGSFELALNIKGEVQGKNAVVINMPDELKRRDLRIYGIKIKDLVVEGKEVKAGDWIATLDAAQIKQQIQSNSQELQERKAQLNDSKIDSTIQLTNLREELAEFKYDLEYKNLELEQSKYESPAYQRKKQVEYNKTIRNMEKKKRDYQLKRLSLNMKTMRIQNHFDDYTQKDAYLKAALRACQVTAPQAGMVMYAKLWGGRKLRIGDEVSRWSPTIATLPDMSVLVSETYVQEIDITKIAPGDSVEINIDALPESKYSGVITKIANVGQELPGFDSKVFKVLIDMNENGKEIKPSMTTDNKIMLTSMDDVIKIPRYCLFSEDGSSYVFLRSGGKIWKKEVITGPENDEEIVIKKGLQEKDRICTSIPDNAENLTFYED